MKTFADEYEKINKDETVQSIKNASRNSVESAIAKENLSYRDFLALLSDAADEYLDEMAERSKKDTDAYFGKNIQMYIPVYISNECVNSCLYCGFNAENRIPRKTLSFDEIKAELEKIKSFGFKNLLILTGEHPGRADAGYIKKAVKAAKKYFPFVSLEVYPMQESEYKELVGAGASGITVYQETYDREVYDSVHRAGPKKNFRYRLETPDRALSAGFRKAGIGALLGLYDYRFEAAMLGAHAAYLMKKYWRSEISISFPRLRENTSGFKPAEPVTDRQLVKMIFALRIYLKHAGITVSTRESAVFRDNMIGYGITMMSAGSKTNPGGYDIYENDKTKKQFDISDSRTTREIAGVIRQKGYYPVFKDWSDSFEGVKK
ncbi:MAG: 2-iminoacetate synthase ThiH [Candidatus Goldiibacteriota bacterium]